MSLQLMIDQVADAIGMINSTSTPARRLVGGGVVVDAKGRVLVCYSDFAYQGWHFPKGGLDEGETTLQGAIREVEEESGGVKAKAFSGNVSFELQPGRVYREPIGFGSSRAEPPKHRTSERISHGAKDLLIEAAKEARIDLDELHQHRYEIFDALVGRGIKVAWVTVPTYHILVYDAGVATPTFESMLVEWHTPAEIRNLRAPDKPNSKPRIGGAARTLLERPDFDELVEKAKAEARLVPIA
ncbi:MAG TPA: NUDIX hydrolase [Gemmataceae bacterium]|nr:NUDIX hydrolase [Gemmataceae bacterium]